MCNKTWLVFSFSQPASRQSGRVKALRRLAALGAVGLKTGLYVLPWSETHHEQCLWLAGEVETLAQQMVMCLSLGGPRVLPAEEIATVVGKFSRYGLKQR